MSPAAANHRPATNQNTTKALLIGGYSMIHLCKFEGRGGGRGGERM